MSFSSTRKMVAADSAPFYGMASLPLGQMLVHSFGGLGLLAITCKLLTGKASMEKEIPRL